MGESEKNEFFIVKPDEGSQVRTEGLSNLRSHRSFLRVFCDEFSCTSLLNDCTLLLLCEGRWNLPDQLMERHGVSPWRLPSQRELGGAALHGRSVPHRRHEV